MIDSSTGEHRYVKMPCKRCLNYQKSKTAFISRLDTEKFIRMIHEFRKNEDSIFVILERPFVNPRFFSGSISAVRFLESTLTVLESMKIPYEFIDSKVWQREMLPRGTKGKDNLKAASLGVAKRLFPKIDYESSKLFDGDGILIAEYNRRKNAGR